MVARDLNLQLLDQNLRYTITNTRPDYMLIRWTRLYVKIDICLRRFVFVIVRDFIDVVVVELRPIIIKLVRQSVKYIDQSSEV